MKGKCARRGCFLALRPMARFRSTAIFSPWASVLFRFAALPLGFPSYSPSVDRFPPHTSFGAPSLSFFALLLDLFSSSVSFFSALFGRRKNAFAPPPSRARVMRPRVPCFE